MSFFSSRHRDRSLSTQQSSSGAKRCWISTIRLGIRIYRGYIRIHFWSIMILAIIALISGLRIVGVLGMVFGLLIYLTAPCFDRWLEKLDKRCSS